MRETPGARAAYADYLALGPERSLAKLLALYQTRTGPAPTRHLTTLKQWSVAFGWQLRLQHLADQAAHEAEARQLAYVRSIMEEGYALVHERVRAIKRLSAWLEDELDDDEKRWLREKKSIVVGQTEITGKDGKVVGRRTEYETFWVRRPNVGWVSKLLEAFGDVAAETGGRVTRTELTGKDGGPVAVKVYTDPRMENPLEADWSDAPPPRNAPNP